MKNLKLYLWRFSCLLLATLAITFLWENTLTVFLAVLLCAVMMNIKSNKTEIISYIVVAVLATLLEALANCTGAWSYTHKHFLNFSIWTPLYWGMGGVVMKDVYEIVRKLVDRKK